MSIKNVLAFVGAIALVVIFRVQLLQIINLINTNAQQVPGR